MIHRARAPLRLGLAGGGTDVSPYCDIYGGQVLNATINHYAHCSIEPHSEPFVEFHAMDIGVVEKHSVSTGNLDSGCGLALHRETYNLMVARYNYGKPLSMRLYTRSDAPPGSGLGSSSTMVVSMVQAYLEWLRLPLGEYDVARIAFEIERQRLQQCGGRQDQYAAAFGGVNFMEFYEHEHVVVNPLRVRGWIMNELESSLILYNSSYSRNSSTIIQDQISRVEAQDIKSLEATHQLKADASRMKESLLKGDMKSIASILNNSWKSKKGLASSISNDSMDDAIEAGMKSGALAAKVSGAGGGGFIMFLVNPIHRIDVEKAITKHGGSILPFRFCLDGAESWTIS